MSAATARLRLLLAVLVGGAVAELMPLLSATTADAPSAALLAALAFAVAAVLMVGSHSAPSALSAFAARPGMAEAAPPFIAGRVTDPLHHPLRPRAPGLV